MLPATDPQDRGSSRRMCGRARRCISKAPRKNDRLYNVEKACRRCTCSHGLDMILDKRLISYMIICGSKIPFVVSLQGYIPI